MHKLLQVELIPDKTKYEPGETALIKVTTRNAAGKGVPAELSMAVVDKAIFALQKSMTKPMHSSFYFFRPRRTNASSSLTWVGTYNWGGGGGGGGGGGSNRLVDTLYWNPNISTDSNGETSISVPLSSSESTWRAQIYASTDSSEVGQGFVDFVVARP